MSSFNTDESETGVQVLGQMELINLLDSGGQHYSHCISIGNPRKLFRRKKPDETMPDMFRQHFNKILRLSFYDVEEKRYLRPWHFPKRIPQRSDVHKVIKFFTNTKDVATGYTIHCWQGISRSTAIALGILYLITGSETEAKKRLYRMRSDAFPHQKIVKWFDEELGCNLYSVNREIHQSRLDRMKKELDLSEESLLEELPVAEEE